jgi:hypothetical protein
MQRAAGVSSFTDMSNLLNTAPREVVELLRITAVIRSVTGPLGALRADRLRLNGAYALRGSRGGGGGGGAPTGGRAKVRGAGGDDSSSSGGDGLGARGGFAWRLKLESRLGLIRGYCFAHTILMRTLLATLHVFGQNVPLG